MARERECTVPSARRALVLSVKERGKGREFADEGREEWRGRGDRRDGPPPGPLLKEGEAGPGIPCCRAGLKPAPTAAPFAQRKGQGDNVVSDLVIGGLNMSETMDPIGLAERVDGDVGSARLLDGGDVVAGEVGSWRLVFVVGARGLARGGVVRIGTDSDTDWELPQVHDPSGADYLSVVAPEGCGGGDSGGGFDDGESGEYGSGADGG